MLDLFALGLILLSLIVFVASIPVTRKKTPNLPDIAAPAPALHPLPSSGQSREVAKMAPVEEEVITKEDTLGPRSRPVASAAPEESSAGTAAPTGTRAFEGAFPAVPGALRTSPGSASHGITPTARDESVQSIERKASLIYWERMCLEEEFDLIVSLHRPEFKVVPPEGATTHESETVYRLPRTGHVRVVPVCSGCNISPASRDIRVEELDTENRAAFKVLPLKEGDFDLTVEFHMVMPDGRIQPIGTEKTRVTVQAKPIQLNVGALSISVSRRVPAFFSMCGSFFGLTSFVVNKALGIDINESLIAASAAVSASLAGTVMILLAMLMLIRGLKPLMREIQIKLR
ncbi:MAG: hypothetical protein HXY34_08815 [Candidatus Thorarchaeota archaeon]|nr:hypothetical protein [Candidatus Thorarchaeota archaeon]